jgi:hypothetical protein
MHQDPKSAGRPRCNKNGPWLKNGWYQSRLMARAASIVGRCPRHKVPAPSTLRRSTVAKARGPASQLRGACSSDRGSRNWVPSAAVFPAGRVTWTFQFDPSRLEQHPIPPKSPPPCAFSASPCLIGARIKSLVVSFRLRGARTKIRGPRTNTQALVSYELGPSLEVQE